MAGEEGLRGAEAAAGNSARKRKGKEEAAPPQLLCSRGGVAPRPPQKPPPGGAREGGDLQPRRNMPGPPPHRECLAAPKGNEPTQEARKGAPGVNRSHMQTDGCYEASPECVSPITVLERNEVEPQSLICQISAMPRRTLKSRSQRKPAAVLYFATEGRFLGWFATLTTAVKLHYVLHAPQVSVAQMTEYRQVCSPICF